MTAFRHLAWVALLSGAIAGLALFLLQHLTVVPLIERAEGYETAAAHAMPGHVHQDEGWQPADGLQRTAFTALSTALAGIAFAAVLVAAMSLNGRRVDLRRGAAWGLAGCACFVLAPALGMLPLPPGVEAASLPQRQFWWIGTALSTAAGLWLLFGSNRSWPAWLAGIALLVLPHAIGAPPAPGASVVPADLARSFALASIATNAAFWLLLGPLIGMLYQRRAATASWAG